MNVTVDMAFSIDVEAKVHDEVRLDARPVEIDMDSRRTMHTRARADRTMLKYRDGPVHTLVLGAILALAAASILAGCGFGGAAKAARDTGTLFDDYGCVVRGIKGEKPCPQHQPAP